MAEIEVHSCVGKLCPIMTRNSDYVQQCVGWCACLCVNETSKIRYEYCGMMPCEV